MYGKFAVRDIGILLATLIAWQMLAGFSAESGPVGDFLGVMLGLAVGLCGFIVHEWGHFGGALLSGSAVRPGDDLKRYFIFSFDTKNNSRLQFTVMSFGGFLATAFVFWFCYWFLPPEWLASRVACGVAALLVFLGIFVEGPLVLWAWFGKSLPPIEVVPTTSPVQEPESMAV